VGCHCGGEEGVRGMGIGGTLIYKCRFCGGLEKSTHVPDGDKAIIYMVKGIETPKNWGPLKPGILSVHNCSNGYVGVTDLVGVEFDES